MTEPSPAPTGSFKQRAFAIGERAKTIALPIVLLATTVLFVRFLHRHYPVQKWLFWRYATFWSLTLVWVLGCVSIGHLTIKKLLRRTLPTLEHLTIAFALGVLEFAIAMFLLGAVKGIRSWAFPILPLGMLAVGLRPFLRYAARWRRHVRFRTPSAPRRSPWLLFWFAFGFLGCVMIYFSILAPENAQFDSRWKHLALAEEMLATGGIRRFPEGSTAETNPHLPSFLYVWAFMLPGASLWDKVVFSAHIEFAAFLGNVFAIPALVRRLVPKARAEWTWAARFLFPGVFLYDSSVSLGADHVGALFVIPVYLLLLRAYDKLEPRMCVLLGMMAAGGIMAKLTALLMLVPVPAIAIVVRGVWFTRPAVLNSGEPGARRAWIMGPVATLCAGLAFTSPFWLKNWILYGDPIYPSLHKYLHLRPWTEDAAELFEYGYKAHQFWRPSRDLEGLKKTLAALFNFSFVPNDYSHYHGKVPVFGSLFTLLLVALPFFRKTKRIWGLVGCVHLSIFVWYWTHHQDRYLQTIAPWMAAVTASILIHLHRAGFFTRIAAGALVGSQIVWGGDVYFIPGHIMIKSPVRVVSDLIASGYKKEYDKRFHVFGPWSDIGRALPPKAMVMLHDNHNHLGINAASVSDWGGWQFGISYGRTKSAREIYDTYVKMGVTHLTWETNRSQAWDSIAGDIMFYNFAFKYVQGPKSFGSVTMGRMPTTPPPAEFEDTVAFIGCDKGGHKTGLYRVRDLTTPVFGPNNKKLKGPSVRLAEKGEPTEDLVNAASFVVASTKCKKTIPASMRGAFRQTPKRRKVKGEQVEIWIRTDKKGPEPSGTAGPAPSPFDDEGPEKPDADDDDKE